MHILSYLAFSIVALREHLATKEVAEGRRNPNPIPLFDLPADFPELSASFFLSAFSHIISYLGFEIETRDPLQTRVKERRPFKRR
jgi:hypothetical protein